LFNSFFEVLFLLLCNLKSSFRLHTMYRISTLHLTSLWQVQCKLGLLQAISMYRFVFFVIFLVFFVV